jgi:hypothetical protein
MAKRRKASSMQGSAAQTTRSINQFVVNNFSVVKLPPSYRNEHKRWAASYRHINKLTGQNPSPGVVRYAMRYRRSR